MTATGAMARRWRSLLFAPGDNPALVEKAAGVGADALIFDLEDAVPPPNKAKARDALRGFAGSLAGHDADLLVRINIEAGQLPLDVAILPPQTRAVLVPKADCAQDLVAVDVQLARREAALGLKTGSIAVIPIIESPRSLFGLPAIAAGPRVVGLAFGTEDFSLALGVAPTSTSLTLPAQLVCLAAAAGEVMAFAVPFSIADFRDHAGWREAATTSRAFGATGGLCIHPGQVKILNEVFSPTQAELAWADRVVHAWTATDAEARGVIVMDGKMIDPPVFRRAQALVAMAARP